MGLVAGVLEPNGIAAVVLSCLAEITEQVQPPKWLDLPWPLGFPLGAAGDLRLQRRVLEAALELPGERGPRPLRRSFPDKSVSTRPRRGS